MIFQDEAGLVRFRFVLDVQGSPKTTHAAPNDYEVKDLTGVVRGQVIRGEFTISYPVGRFEDLPGISRGSCDSRRRRRARPIERRMGGVAPSSGTPLPIKCH